MAEQRPTHLRVVHPTRTTAPSRHASREDYWTQVRALRDERERLRAG